MMIGHRFLSGLRIDHKLLYQVKGLQQRGQHRGWEPLHIQQSPLDKSCGLTCVLMLTMLVDGLPREQALSVAWSTRAKLKKLWAVAESGYFRGTSSAAIERHLRALGHIDSISHAKGARSEVLQRVAKNLANDNPALLLIGSSDRAGLHWVMATGVEYATDGTSWKAKAPGKQSTATALLGLDPYSPPPVCSAFNWRMPIEPDKKSRRTSIATTSCEGDDRQLQRVVILRRGQ